MYGQNLQAWAWVQQTKEEDDGFLTDCKNLKDPFKLKVMLP